MSDNPLEHIKWTPDCQGKWDYDGELVYVSTRYWPRGGGFWLMGPGIDGIQTGEDRPEIKPSAHSGVYVRGVDDPIAELEIEGDTEAEVKVAVERWVREQYEGLRKHLLNGSKGR